MRQSLKPRQTSCSRQHDATGPASRPLRIHVPHGIFSQHHSKPCVARLNTLGRHIVLPNPAVSPAAASHAGPEAVLTQLSTSELEASTAGAVPSGPQYDLPVRSPTVLEAVGGATRDPSAAPSTSGDADGGAGAVSGRETSLSPSGVASDQVPTATAPVGAGAAAAAPPAADSTVTATTAVTARGEEASTSGSDASWPGAGRGRGRGGGGRGGGRGGVPGRSWQPGQSRRPYLPPQPPQPPPPYAVAQTSMYVWPRPQQDLRARPNFLAAYPVPPGKTFNVNSFLGKGDPHRGQYLVLEPQYRDFLESYAAALDNGYALYLTENYHQRVYKFFLELDWDWDTDLALVMEVTPQLLALAEEVARGFYRVPYGSTITSIRTPYKVHMNFPALLTTELLACRCRDRLLEECTARLGPRYGSAVDWERLIDFPHGSLRLMGSRKAVHMDSDPMWVRDKAYHPARLTPEGKWQPGRITPALLVAASIFPSQRQVAAFEKSPSYLDMIFTDLEAYKKKIAERRQERARRREERERQQQLQQQQGAEGSPAGSSPSLSNLPPGSRKNPLVVRLEVQPDDTVALKIHVKSRFRHKGQQKFNYSQSPAPGEANGEADGEQQPQPQTQQHGQHRAAAEAASQEGAEPSAAGDASAAAAGAALQPGPGIEEAVVVVKVVAPVEAATESTVAEAAEAHGVAPEGGGAC